MTGELELNGFRPFPTQTILRFYRKEREGESKQKKKGKMGGERLDYLTVG